MDQLDGKSDMVRNVQFDLENVISTLKQQLEAQENKLRGTEQELIMEKAERGRLRKDLEKLTEKNSAQTKEVDKLNRDLFQMKLKIQ